ncbi:hypothetical protein TW85_04995 [Marinomonas sp. S3726]|uniref:phosphoribosyltransferase-like protein n=1 Tax=Marinomonas sp. S3726 TaxID=579484 RepID=UPI0005FA409A|nr:hypothetical protein [Marinomonas sp. S3726]KJZ15399.1 hypothetical protein TW85_04995 [Marinomonas sp. S3726]
MSDKYNARSLIHTEQGKKWLLQFNRQDQEAAAHLANSLTLVSQSEFRRNLQNKIIKVSEGIDGKVALFSVREIKKNNCREVIPFYHQVKVSEDGQTVNSVEDSADLGSEAIVAQLIRQMSKANPSKYLNHPSLEALRSSRCNYIIFVDDFIGSGRRVRDFLTSFWLVPSVVSWLSTKHINFKVIAYSGTETGISWVNEHKSNPEVLIHMEAPTINSMFWPSYKKDEVIELCRKYGRIANKNKKNMWLGFKQSMATLVFEHGCPNNTPLILWEPTKGNNQWIGLFPNRAITANTMSVFPPEVVQGDPIKILQNIGQKTLAKSGAMTRRGEFGQTVLIVLALIAKSKRKRASLCFATGLSVDNFERVIERCIKWQYLTPQRRITQKGLRELAAARKLKPKESKSLDIGSFSYYPSQLREAAYD